MSSATPNYIPQNGPADGPPSTSSESLDLCDAILGNSSSLVKYWLTVEKKNPNARPKLPLYDDAPKDVATGKVDEAERILGELDTYDCTPLHIAIVNAYHNGRMDGIASKQREASLAILDMLLTHGADTSAVCHHVLFCNVGDLNISSPGAPLDPFGLCLSFKKVAQSQAQKHIVHSEERVDMMDQVMDRLIKARIQETRTPTQTVTIPNLVADTYRDLCGSSLYSDVTIQSNDGHFIPAHRNVLSAASPVWKQLLQDLKVDENSNAENPVLSIPRSARVLRTVLEFVYTGQLDEPVLDAETAPLLSVATEYQLDALEQVCAAKCGERLTIHNVRVMLDIGQRHQAQWIQKECLDFLQRQPLPVVLGHPKLVALHKENPLLWEQLLMAVGGYYDESEIPDGEEGTPHAATVGATTTMSAVTNNSSEGKDSEGANSEGGSKGDAESNASTVRV